MAAVFTADYEGLYSIHRKAVGVVCDSTQQNQEPHSKVKRQVWCLHFEFVMIKGWLPVTFHSIVYRSVMSVIVFHVDAILVLLCPPSHQTKAHHLIWPVNVHPMTRPLKTPTDWMLKLIWIFFQALTFSIWNAVTDVCFQHYITIGNMVHF